jgi:hypothetical protein
MIAGNGSRAGAANASVPLPDQEEMTMSFRIKGLPAEHFSHLFRLPDEELAEHHAVR